MFREEITFSAAGELAAPGGATVRWLTILAHDLGASISQGSEVIPPPEQALRLRIHSK